MSDPAGGSADKDACAQVDIAVHNSGQGVREALAHLTGALNDHDLEPEDAGTVQLVVAEILNNILEHANLPDGPCAPIRIRAAMRDDGLHLAILDKGEPMPDGKLPTGHPPALDVELRDLPEGGFGWFLIRDLARDIAYRREAAENHLSLRLLVGPNRLS